MSDGFADYDALKTTLADWLSRLGDPELATRIPDFIFLAEVRIERETDWPHNERVVSAALTPGSSTVLLPADLSWPLAFELSENPPRTVEIVSSGQSIRNSAGGGGQPGRIVAATLVGTAAGLTLELSPAPANAGNYRLRYMAGIAKLSGANPTSWLLEQGPDALLYGSLLHAAPFLHDDERVSQWEAFFRDAVRSLKKIAFRQRTGGGTLRVRPDRWA